jgi:hypothetical protein
MLRACWPDPLDSLGNNWHETLASAWDRLHKGAAVKPWAPSALRCHDEPACGQRSKWVRQASCGA